MVIHFNPLIHRKPLRILLPLLLQKFVTKENWLALAFIVQVGLIQQAFIVLVGPIQQAFIALVAPIQQAFLVPQVAS